MAKLSFIYRINKNKKRSGVHSKNASRRQNGYKKKYRTHFHKYNEWIDYEHNYSY